MFLEFQEKDKYYQEYINLLAIRSAYSNIALESRDADLSLPNLAIPIMNFKDATIYIFENQELNVKIYPNMIQKVNAIINRGQYLAEGYRKVDVLTGLNFEAIPSREVANRVMMLIHNYYNVWTYLSPYEREAKFALNFIRIQPFEDGNKRTASILINYNLCKDLHAPIIIDKAHTAEYLKYIENYDEEGLAKLFEKLSKKEFEFMIQLYRQLYYDIEEVPENTKTL